MTTFRTHYDNLKITRDAPNAVICAAYKALIQKYHPDIFDGTEQEALKIAKVIKNSYEVLIDPDKRAEHDRWVSEQEGQEAEIKKQGKAWGQVFKFEQRRLGCRLFDNPTFPD